MERRILMAVAWADLIVCALIRAFWVLALVIAAVTVLVWRGKDG